MPKEFKRIDRINKEIGRQLAGIIHQQMDEARVKLVSVTHVSTSKDMGISKIYVTAMVEPSEQAALIKALNSHRVQFRMALSKILQMRYTPELHFLYDDTIARYEEVSDLIAQARRRNEVVVDDESRDSNTNTNSNSASNADEKEDGERTS